MQTFATAAVKVGRQSAADFYEKKRSENHKQALSPYAYPLI